MIIAILADDAFRKKFMEKTDRGEVEIVWADSLRSLLIISADAYIDLLFDVDPERIAKLKQLLPSPVLVLSAAHTLVETGAPFIRLVGLPGLHKRSIAKIAVTDRPQEKTVKSIFDQLGLRFQFVRDTARKEK